MLVNKSCREKFLQWGYRSKNIQRKESQCILRCTEVGSHAPEEKWSPGSKNYLSERRMKNMGALEMGSMSLGKYVLELYMFLAQEICGKYFWSRNLQG